MKKVLFLLSFICIVLQSNAQIQVDKTKTYLTTQNGKPFFWMADTGWELFHRLSREEAVNYLNTRAKQEFNIVMAVALAEVDGIRQPNYYGRVPFKDISSLQWDVTPGDNPLNKKEYDYWDHMDFVIQEASKRNMYVGLLPAWGDKVTYNWGEGPMVFNNNPEAAYAYTKKLVERYKKQWNIIWILGGDRSAVYEREGKKHDDRPVWRAMAKAIEETCGADVFITYHPGWPETSAYLQNEDWLDMYALQSGHASKTEKPWDIIRNDLHKTPKRPVMDLEPCYEDHPVFPWDNKWTREERGYFDDYDVRARIYRGVFAGACGAVYGHHQVWQFLDTLRNPPIWVGDTIIGWQKAIHSAGANQMKHLKNLMYSRNDFNRTEDSLLVVSNRGKDYTDIIIATKQIHGRYAMIYLPQPKEIIINLDRLSAGKKKVSWLNPATGKYHNEKKQYDKGKVAFTPPSLTQKDWVLIVDVL